MVETRSQGSINEGQILLPYETPALRVFGRLHLLTKGSGGFNGDGGQTMMATMSDPRTKENVIEIGRHALGFGLYVFSYKAGFGCPGRHSGAMADEVERVVPSAVSVGADGYKRVVYDLLGVSPNFCSGDAGASIAPNHRRAVATVQVRLEVQHGDAID